MSEPQEYTHEPPTPTDPDTRPLEARFHSRGRAAPALTTTSIISTVWDLRMVNAAVADKLSSGPEAGPFKAMVCIFLFGGNDANNMIVPKLPDPRYTQYQTIRGNLSLASDSLLPLDFLNNAPGLNYGIHPAFGAPNPGDNPGLIELFNQQKVAILSNVGTLAAPTTRAQYTAKSVPLPLQLFSHADQQVQWQTSVPDKPSRTGWGGRFADLLYSLNDNATVSMSLSLAGINTFEVGNVVNAFNVGTGGAVSLTNINAARKAAMLGLLDMQHPNLYENAFSTITNRAIDGADLINAAINASQPAWPFTWPNFGLANQLRMIARLIEKRNYTNAQFGAMNNTRQIYFASVGGYDLHASQVNQGNTAIGAHANLFRELSQSMYAFQKAMEFIGAADQVVTFTMSDFGRTFPTNDDDPQLAGSDHGWGNHQIVMGGTGGGTGLVNGKKLYGTTRLLPTPMPDPFPQLVVNGHR